MAAAGLFLFFLCISIAFFMWSPYSRSFPLPRHWVLGLFGIKLLCALAYGYILSHSSASSDSWEDFKGSIYYARIIHSVPDFFTYSFPDISHWTDVLHYHFWNDLKSNCFQIILLGMNEVTGKNYYTDTLVFSTFTFIGWLELIRLLRILYPGNDPFTYLLPFLFPSFLFFYSGLHPDGLIFALLALFALDVYRLLSGTATKGARVRLLACFAGLVLLKIYVALLLLPVLGGWVMVYRGRIRLQYAWAFIIGGTLLLFVAGCAEMTSRQHIYLEKLNDASSGGVPLEANLSSYLVHFPGALRNGFLPLIKENAYPLFYWIAGAELLLLWALLAMNWISKVRREVSFTFYETGWVYLIAINWLVLGYTIPIAGALIRYRSLFLPFALALLIFPLVKNRISITKK